MTVANERIHFWKTFVLQRDPCGATLLQLARQEPRIVEIAKTAVAIDQHRKIGRVHHALDDIDEFGPGSFVGVAVAE